MSCQKKIIGCIGKCTIGLTQEDLDEISSHIRNTLTNPKGLKVFRKYLEKGERRNDIECLDFYETICQFLQEEKSSSSWRSGDSRDVGLLRDNVRTARDIADDMDGIENIDLALLTQYARAINSSSREEMIQVLEDTKLILVENLKRPHESFREYINLPCPNT